MSSAKNNDVLRTILDKIELPNSAYEKAEKRYKDLGGWLHRQESTCVNFDPHVFPQGSFRLGTAIRPDDEEEYDLDMGCNLRQGLETKTVTQERLKQLVGTELELYRKARGIKEGLAEKKRCWRLEYADDLSFHMDIVPCIPESEANKNNLLSRMVETSKFDQGLAEGVSQLAVAITDNTDPNYTVINDDWRISNPEGYSLWFENRMKTARELISERELETKASIDSLPSYRWKTPLQQVIQLLKRHRDTMYKDNQDSKPISVIITTLAAKAYNGESEIVSALNAVLSAMEEYISDQVPMIPNPVNPVEDFADKWYDEKSAQYRLKDNFYKWLLQAKADFRTLCSSNDPQRLVNVALARLDLKLDATLLARTLGAPAVTEKPTLAIQSSDPKPWCKL